jgi:hypothetical protein
VGAYDFGDKQQHGLIAKNSQVIMAHKYGNSQTTHACKASLTTQMNGIIKRERHHLKIYSSRRIQPKFKNKTNIINELYKKYHRRAHLLRLLKRTPHVTK